MYRKIITFVQPASFITSHACIHHMSNNFILNMLLANNSQNLVQLFGTLKDNLKIYTVTEVICCAPDECV